MRAAVARPVRQRPARCCKLAAVISVATIITYLVVPISVMVLRRTAPDLHRPLRVPGLYVLAPLAFVGLTFLEGHFVTPTIVGRRLMLSPLLVVLALAFWTWMWGPFGALLATPLSIIALVVVNHLFPNEDMKLPD